MSERWRGAALAAALLALAACETGGVWANVPVDNSPDGQACRRYAATAREALAARIAREQAEL